MCKDNNYYSLVVHFKSDLTCCFIKLICSVSCSVFVKFLFIPQPFSETHRYFLPINILIKIKNINFNASCPWHHYLLLDLNLYSAFPDILIPHSMNFNSINSIGRYKLIFIIRFDICSRKSKRPANLPSLQ